MQLRILLLLVFSSNFLKAQEDSAHFSFTPEPYKLNEVSADFLFTYYEQNGDHSAVTGGTGTEHLTDFINEIVVYVQKDSLTSYQVSAAVSFITSASMDEINPYRTSSSRHEVRGDLGYSWQKRNPETRNTWGWSAAVSLDVDYLSTSVSGSWAKESRNKNREINTFFRFYNDTWVWLVQPIELRYIPRNEMYSSNKRYTYHGSATLSQILTPRLQGSFTTDLVYQSGLLSIPFNRVYFDDGKVAVEQLPDSRFKVPMSVQANYYLSDFMTLRFFFRQYFDTWGLDASTVELATPMRFTPFLTFSPFYRYHYQNGIDYFAPYEEHAPGEEYYTSDYDLSDLYSNKYGASLRYAPLYGVWNLRSKQPNNPLWLRYVEVRYANYKRSDGLHANIFTANFGFLF